ncbi:MAG: tetratricopeptide repeat protein [Deltaproteobacteria bacterium]
MSNRKFWILVSGFMLAFGTVADGVSATKKAPKRTVTAGITARVPIETGIVPAADRISDDDARLALARVLSYDDSLLEESVREYGIFLRNRPLQTDVRYELAEVYVRQKKYRDALQEFNTVLLQQPENVRVKLAVGRIYLWTQNLEKAAFIFDELGRNKSANADVFLELARAYSWSKQYDKAIAAYQEAIRRMDKAGLEVYAELGDTYLYVAQLSYAIENYRKALALNPLSDMVEKKLALALSWAGHDQEALSRLEKLYARFPDDREIVIELGRVFVRRQEPKRALLLLEAMQAKHHPKDVEFLLAVADIEAYLGHAKKCRDLYLKSLDLSKNDKKILLRYADQMMMWGDFHGAEKVYRNHLKAQPDDVEVMLRLALVLLSSERYEEAEGLYQRLLLNDQATDKVLLELAKLKISEKDFDAALSFVDRFLSGNQGGKSGHLVRADALYAAGKHKESLEAYQFLTTDPSYRLIGLSGMGKAYLKQELPEKATSSFEKVYQAEPENVEAQFHLAGHERVKDDDFVKEILRSAEGKPRKLETWARLYATKGLNDIALKCYRAALSEDSQYFPARIGLAEMLAIDHQYDASVSLYRELAGEFPEVSKILIGQARVLGWSKRYQESIELYEKIHRINPVDPVVLREKARVAVWGKLIDEAMCSYGELLSPTVDGELVTGLATLAMKVKDKDFIRSYKRLREKVEKGSVYEGYEAFDQDFKSYSKSLSPKLRKKIQSKQVELLSTYRIQKAAYLEKQAKALVWNKRFTRAMGVYEELVQFNPGNEEAIFDYAQVECSLGLCDREAKTYKKLLHVDPLHGLAKQAHHRQEIRKNPSLELSHSYWKEEGRGDLARIKRNRSDLLLDIPVWCRYHLGIIGHHWIENPDFTGKSYDANGYTIQFKGVLSPHVKGEAAWTHKEYSDSSFKSKDSGFGHVWFNVRDDVVLGAGFDRTDELYNYFGLKQGLQADTAWVSFSSPVSRQLEISGALRYLDYNDSNSGQYHSLSAAYAFTDHPRIFKVILSGDYRDTRQENISKYDTSGNLTDITHPYWTPKNYIGGGITLEWYHDLSKFFFCGSELHFYDLRLSFGTDSSSNAAVRLEGEWHYEFYDHWSVGIKGTIHRSREWDADGLFGNIKYQF